jgi:cysteinyl-tRNA synthetase
MALRFYNTYSREIEEFHPREQGSKNASMYTCGPTVYSRAHIGNFRAYIFEDLLQRHLELRGYSVNRVMNITDVDDKTIRGARESGTALRDFTKPFKASFFDDLTTLRIKAADSYPAATEEKYIERMIGMIGLLMERDLAYLADDKSVYFRINKFPNYGKLAHFDLTQLQSTGRVKNDEYDKEHVGDFALWKAWDEADGDVAWDSPLLGDQIDIHCGGVDNIFPHHEAEIAQTEGCTGKTFVRYWMHCAHLLVDGQKMSKSLGNFYTIADVLQRGYSGREIRYALMRVNYRMPLNFTFTGMEEARESLQRIDDWLERLTSLGSGASPDSSTVTPPKFEEALDDDLNISAALGFLFETIRETNREMDAGSLPKTTAASWLAWWNRINEVLQLSATESSLPAEALRLAEEREQARLAKDWKKSDQLRDELKTLGWDIRDTKDGRKLTRRTTA